MNHSQEYDYNFKLSFQAEWFDPIAQMKKNFLMSYFPCDNTVELFDIALKKMFLRRSYYENLRMKDVFIGNTVTIYDRLIKILDYADNSTRNFVGDWKEHTFALIKPSGMKHLGDILTDINRNNLTLERLCMVNLTRPEVADLYDEFRGNPQLPFIMEHLCSGPSLALELVGKDCVKAWRDLLGPADPLEAKKTAPDSLRARYGIDLSSNAAHGVDTHEKAVKSACYFFPEGIDRKPLPSIARIFNSTLCLIKPHAIDEGKLGHIVNVISKDFEITAMQMFFLSPTNIEEFIEVYKGVVPNFHAFLHTFLCGPVIALEISAKPGDPENRDVHQEFRKLCGPMDSDIAKQIRPNSLRGMFGVSKYMNAVHCTDLKEDTELELEYFFRILAQ